MCDKLLAKFNVKKEERERKNTAERIVIRSKKSIFIFTPEKGEYFSPHIES